ncbi:hypothetical protein [Maribellus sediminis]|uniref:hypothetical protein n=1 Tax=Maribellus sediminis TaxID=2696285 RepID=UPI00142FF9FE|nr:hypothetical protein [Maribellus sediminis]
MDITRKNYEAYFVDYLEGKLDEKLVDAFIEFLQKNPDLKEELKLFESVEAVPEHTTYTKKDKLYKAKYDEEDAFNFAAIANLEGDISGKEKREFENYLSAHPEKQEDIGLFSKTILTANENIQFEHKNRLYKKPVRKVLFMWAGRVAAVLILALAVFSLINTSNDNVSPDNQLAQVEDKTNTVETIQKEEVSTPVQKTEPEPEVKQIEEPILEKDIQEEQLTPKTIEIKTDKLEKQELIPMREPIEALPEMNPIMASIDVQNPKARLATMTLIYEVDYPEEEHLLADNLKEKLSIEKITKAGLNLVTSISNERFTYQTDNSGKVTEYNYESRLLAFTIPSGKQETE